MPQPTVGADILIETLLFEMPAKITAIGDDGETISCTVFPPGDTPQELALVEHAEPVKGHETPANTWHWPPAE